MLAVSVATAAHLFYALRSGVRGRMDFNFLYCARAHLKPAAAMSSAEDDESMFAWPVCGTVVAVDVAARTVTLSKASPLFQQGMYLLFQEYDDTFVPNDCPREEFFKVAHFTGDTCVLEDELPAHGKVRAGTPFFTMTRTVPTDMSLYGYMDCFSVLNGMVEYVREPEFSLDADCRLGLLQVNRATLRTPDDVMAAWDTVRRNMSTLWQRCRETGVVGRGGATAQRNEDAFKLVLESCARTLELEYTQLALAEVASGKATTGLSMYSSFLSPAPPDMKLTDIMRLLDFYMNATATASLMHRDSVMYKRQYTTYDVWVPAPDNPLCDSCVKAPACFGGEYERDRVRCEGCRLTADVDLRLEDSSTVVGVRRIREDERRSEVCPTRSWTPMVQHSEPVDIAKWLHLQIDARAQPLLFSTFINNYNGVMATVARYMSAADDPRFPVVKPDQAYFSFQNGVYHTETCRFYPYGGADVPVVCALNHIDQYFEPYIVQEDIDGLEVPGYDAILRSQNFSADMIKWLDVFLGRLLFPVGTYDSWEKLLIIKGWAATGKSTIAKAIEHIFGASNVGNIPANCEEQWALASVFNKKIWMCTELSAGWRFPTPVLKSVVSGEVVPIHVKHKTAVDVTWKLPGFAVGNEEPVSWVNDPMNALYRRIVPFPFDVSPKSQDPSIARLFLSNLPRFLVRITRRYFDAVRRVGENPVDSFLPERLKQARQRFLENTQPIVKFLKECPDVLLAPLDIRAIVCKRVPVGTDGAAATTAVSAVLPESGGTNGSAHALRKEWRMSMPDLTSIFKQWWTQMGLTTKVGGGGGNGVPSIMSQDVYMVALQHVGVLVENENRVDYMYGVRRSTSAHENGAQDVVYDRS